MIRFSLLTVLGLALSLQASAKLEDDKDNCVEALSGKRAEFTVIASDRVPSESARYEEYVKELVEPGGVLDKLGIRMTGQIVEFLQGRDLNALTSGSSGGFPVSFYLDGANILRSYSPRGGFALEVVYPGPKYQHGFYRDDNPESNQISIIDHVVGHNNFALISGFPHYRAAQGLQSSRQLDQLLRDLYHKENKDEVQRFYLWALSLVNMVDFYTPYFERSEKFEPSHESIAFDPLGRRRPSDLKHPRVPTENLLPAFAANLAPYEPAWKRQMLDLLHDCMAFRPALVHTQIMNEGWASLMQEILPRHTSRNHHFAFWFQAHRVMQAEDKPNLSDPYSLGVFTWRRIRERFNKRPQIAALATDVEKDRAFIQYANDEIIARMDDAQFLRLGMDQVFVDRYNLAIVRRADASEQDDSLPPPNPPPKEPIAQWIMVSRDAEKVTQAVIDQVLRPKYAYRPRVKLVNFTRPGSGEVELVVDDEVGRTLALDKRSVAPTLYALSQVIQKPVSLSANLVAVEGRRMELVPSRIVVSPRADVKVFAREKESGPESEHVPLTKELAHTLKDYIEDLYLEDSDKRDQVFAESETLKAFIGKTLAEWIDDTPYDSLVSHAPNAAGAIAEYKVMVERRMIKALESAMQNNKVRIVGGRPRVRALPSVVNLQFDQDYANAVHATDEGAPVDRVALNGAPAPSSVFGDYSGSGGHVGDVKGNPGDRMWGPGDPQGGGGRGNKPGEDPADPSWIDIPPDLYAKFLGERVKLPVLNRKPGLARTQATKPGRRMNRMFGQLLPMEILENAYGRGYTRALREGRDPDLDADQTIADGLDGELQPRDIVVKSRTLAKKPDVRAVVTFVLDGSASTANYMEAFKRFVHDIETLIAANYKGLAFRYVVFDTKAHVLKDKSQFFRTQLGGGTEYLAGLKTAHDLFNEEYPRSSWDRYTFLMGDMEDFSPEEAHRKIMELLEDSEYFGVVAGLNMPSSTPDLLAVLANEAHSNPQLGVTVLAEDGGYSLDNIREVLKNTDEN